MSIFYILIKLQRVRRGWGEWVRNTENTYSHIRRCNEATNSYTVLKYDILSLQNECDYLSWQPFYELATILYHWYRCLTIYGYGATTIYLYFRFFKHNGAIIVSASFSCPALWGCRESWLILDKRQIYFDDWNKGKKKLHVFL